jgi:hypothetical protein
MVEIKLKKPDELKSRDYESLYLHISQQFQALVKKDVPIKFL